LTDSNKLHTIYEKIKQGDERALCELFELFKPMLMKYSFVDGKFDEDCFQELSLKLLKCIKSFKYDENEDIYKLLSTVREEELK
jgi:hypothetical protein